MDVRAMEFLAPGALARLLAAGARRVEMPAEVGLLEPPPGPGPSPSTTTSGIPPLWARPCRSRRARAIACADRVLCAAAVDPRVARTFVGIFTLAKGRLPC
ncbi:hypothetical protein ACGF8B_35700 [Streptomyces sp. NPDC047917]|uniref:hypothetical protein n=1 Tax=Streptomyces sp. NPDC047917 TaxID=3365491 RepID=UPI00371D65C6